MHSAFNLTACTFWSCCLTPFVATSLACTCFAYHCCRWTKNLMHTVPKWSNLPHKNRVSYVYGWSRCNSIQSICILYILYNIYGHYTLTIRTQQWLGGHQRELLHLSCIWGPGTVEYFEQKQGSTICWYFSLLMKTMINGNFNSGILLQQPRPGAVQLLPCDSSQSSSIIWTLLLDSFLSYFFQLNRVLPNCMTKLNVQYFNATRIKHEKKLNFN